MKKNSAWPKSALFCLICLLSATHSKSQTVDHNKLVIGVVDSVHSTILGETRTIWVYVPAGADDSTFVKKHYPVVYLLDGTAISPP